MRIYLILFRDSIVDYIRLKVGITLKYYLNTLSTLYRDLNIPLTRTMTLFYLERCIDSFKDKYSSVLNKFSW